MVAIAGPIPARVGRYHDPTGTWKELERARVVMVILRCIERLH